MARSSTPATVGELWADLVSDTGGDLLERIPEDDWTEDWNEAPTPQLLAHHRALTKTARRRRRRETTRPAPRSPRHDEDSSYRSRVAEVRTSRVITGAEPLNLRALLEAIEDDAVAASSAAMMRRWLELGRHLVALREHPDAAALYRHQLECEAAELDVPEPGHRELLLTDVAGALASAGAALRWTEDLDGARAAITEALNLLGEKVCEYLAQNERCRAERDAAAAGHLADFLADAAAEPDAAAGGSHRDESPDATTVLRGPPGEHPPTADLSATLDRLVSALLVLPGAPQATPSWRDPRTPGCRGGRTRSDRPDRT